MNAALKELKKMISQNEVRLTGLRNDLDSCQNDPFAEAETLGQITELLRAQKRLKNLETILEAK